MSAATFAWILIAVAFLAANLPWLTERVFLFAQPQGGSKRAWVRWLEWLVLYFVVGGIALGMEQKVNGEIYPQDWEFYAVTLCLFLVFALPGFVYRHELKQVLARR